MAETSSAFNVFIRVKPLNPTETTPSDSDPMVRVRDNQIFVRDPGPLGDYIVLLLRRG